MYMTNKPYPLKMRPCFRHGADTPWAGAGINEFFYKSAPDLTGESLEISALPGHNSVVVNGPCAGKSLGEIAREWGADLTGRECEVFPLLVKIISAGIPLSVQVHPDDIYAKKMHNKLGKSEAWYVIDAEPGAKIMYGLNVSGGDELKRAVHDGQVESTLNWIDAKPGDVFYIPHGTVHALGAGTLIYEIQQSSDVTYRFYDWNRVDAQGKSRELHVEDALNVSIASRKHTLLRQTVCGTELRVDDPNFKLYTMDLSGEKPLPFAGKMRCITALCECEMVGWFTMKPGDSALIPAVCECIISGYGRILISTEA